jgi:DNA-binding transcriptional LysR family regulator
LLRLPCEETHFLEVVPVLREAFIVVLPRSHALAACRAISWRALAAEPCINFPRRAAPGFFDTLMSHCRRVGVTLNVVMEADHLHTQQNLVALGFGVSLQPASSELIRREGLVYRPLAPPILYAHLGMTYRRDTNSEALSAFQSVVVEVFPRLRLTAGASQTPGSHTRPRASSEG